MVPYQYTEDIFLEFYNLMVRHGFALTGQDQSATYNFYSLISNGSLLTQSQAGLIVKILKKHKVIAQKYNFDYSDQIENPVWKNEFRILDLTKKIFVEKDETGELLIFLKFPFSMKETFDREFSTEKDHFRHSKWNQEKKLREVKFSEINVVALYEFLQKHNFEIDDSFLEAVELVEEIWANQEDFVPHSTIFENQLVLINSNEYADAYFEKNSTGDIYHDMLLAKAMQFPLKLVSKSQEIVEKIASSNNNIFWIDSNEKLFDVYKKIDGKISIVLDRASNKEQWLETFIKDSEKCQISRSDIRICFRESKESNTGLNQWIKDNDLGRPVEDGKIFIFEHKPAKWLFKNNIDVKIVVTNNLYINPNTYVNDWMTSHPCVIYLGEIKPTLPKGATSFDIL
jgi:hypothetical protein